MDLLDRLLGHDHWATAKLLDLSRGLTDEHLDLPFDVGHQTLRATFEHMSFNVEFWTATTTAHWSRWSTATSAPSRPSRPSRVGYATSSAWTTRLSTTSAGA